jgi:ribosomal protein S18 acetylase RimI-like enzyme
MAPKPWRPSQTKQTPLTCIPLQPYRSLGLGSTALQQVFTAASQYNTALSNPIPTKSTTSTTSTFNPSQRKITSFYLHVHVPNAEARTFYERYGFVERERIAGYYRKLGASDGEERDAWVLEKPIGQEAEEAK